MPSGYFSAKNYWKQAAEADKWFECKMAILFSYKEQFPHLVDIIQDCVNLKDSKHYFNWRREQGFDEN